jgi:hypothetical protein
MAALPGQADSHLSYYTKGHHDSVQNAHVLRVRSAFIVVVKKTFRYPNVFFYYRNAFFLQPLMPQSFIPEHFYGKGYKV